MSVNDPNGDQRREEAPKTVESSQKQSKVVRDANRLFHEYRRVVSNRFDTGELLHELSADAEHGTVQEILRAILKHCTEATASSCLSFSINGELDLAIWSFKISSWSWIVFALFCKPQGV
jgi:hypothetical protein